MARKNITDLMQDPYYAEIMLQIESKIHEADSRSEKDYGVSLTDSNVKSAIRGAMGFVKSRPPLLKSDKPRDECLGRLATELAGIGELLEQTQDVVPRDYLRALLAVEDSLKTRHDHHGGPRGYLDFLGSFLNEGNIY